MARFTDEWLNELLSKNDILDVIGGYLPLTKRGANYWAKCPWHAETRPSFSVTPSKQMFYCFSCRKGGSAINFVMEYEKLRNKKKAIVLVSVWISVEIFLYWIDCKTYCVNIATGILLVMCMQLLCIPEIIKKRRRDIL